MTFNDFMIPICLPQEDDSETKKVIASGWGSTDYFEDQSEVLMKVMIEYFDHTICDKSFKGVDNLKKGAVDWNRMVCAGSNNKTGDTCK